MRQKYWMVGLMLAVSIDAIAIEPAPLITAKPDHPTPQTQQVPAETPLPRKVSTNAPQTEADKVRDEAFQAMLQTSVPFTPEEILKLRRAYDETQAALATSVTTPPTPTSSSRVISLKPGALPPVVRLSGGFVSALVFSDVTGAAWPIVSYSVGDPDTFNIQWDQKSNTLFIQSLRYYAHGNMAIQLKDLNTPITLSLVSGQKEVDYRVDFQVGQRGPEAKVPVKVESIPGVPTNANGLPQASVNAELIDVLDGIPPKGAIKLDIPINLGEAWRKERVLYFRTPLTVISPAWDGFVTSADGTKVYKMALTPMILASVDGRTIQIPLKGL